MRILFALLLGGSLLFTSCKDDDDPIVAPLPTGPSSFTVTPDTVQALAGDQIMINFVGSSSNELVAVYIIPSTTFVTDTIDATGLSTIDSTYTFTVPATAMMGDEYTVSLSLEDTDGSLYQLFAQTVVQVTGTPLSAQVMGTVWHLWGDGHGAWDLVNDSPMLFADTDTDKDIVNQSPNNGAFVSDFEALSSTMFVPTTLVSSELASAEQLMAEYAAGTPQSSISGAIGGSTYVALLRDGNYAVIIVETVDPAAMFDSGSTMDLGNMTFSYKKTM